MSVSVDNWEKAKAYESHLKRQLVERLLEERTKLHEKQLEELFEEEIVLDEKLLEIKGRNFFFQHDHSIVNAVYNSLRRIAEQRWQLKLNFWKDKMQLCFMLQEITLDEKSKHYLSK